MSPEIEPSNIPRASLLPSEQPLLDGIKPHRIGTFSSHGIKPGANGTAFAKINQDRGLLTYPFNEDAHMALFAVFDGHGSNGEQVSEYVMWKVQELLQYHMNKDGANLHSVAEACLIRAFEETDRALVTSGVSAKVSGTAAVVCLIHKDTMWVANCGDSRAVLATREGSSNHFKVTALTEDQKPDNPEEEERILRMGGFVTRASPQFGPPRVWLRKGEGPGLAMARSIGDHVCKRACHCGGPTARASPSLPHHCVWLPRSRTRGSDERGVPASQPLRGPPCMR